MTDQELRESYQDAHVWRQERLKEWDALYADPIIRQVFSQERLDETKSVASMIEEEAEKHSSWSDIPDTSNNPVIKQRKLEIGQQKMIIEVMDKSDAFYRVDDLASTGLDDKKIHSVLHEMKERKLAISQTFGLTNPVKAYKLTPNGKKAAKYFREHKDRLVLSTEFYASLEPSN